MKHFNGQHEAFNARKSFSRACRLHYRQFSCYVEMFHFEGCILLCKLSLSNIQLFLGFLTLEFDRFLKTLLLSMLSRCRCVTKSLLFTKWSDSFFQSWCTVRIHWTISIRNIWWRRMVEHKLKWFSFQWFCSTINQFLSEFSPE